MHFDFEYLGSDKWRFSVLLRSGRVAVREGKVEALSRLALRAQRLFEFWSRVNATKTTLPVPLPTRPAIPSAVRPNQARFASDESPSVIRARETDDTESRTASGLRPREHPSTIPSVGVRKRTNNGE